MFDFLHLVPTLVAAFLVFYAAIGGVVLIINILKDSPEPCSVFVKRYFMMPTIALKDSTHLSAAVKAIVILVLVLFLGLESYRYSGFDTRIGSYTEYPYARSCYYVMVPGQGSKYYKLPASIRRNNESSGFHYIEKAFWPNGGVLYFSEKTEPEWCEVKLNQYSEVAYYDSARENSYTMDVFLTNEIANDFRVDVTQGTFTLAQFFYLLPIIFFLVYFLPLKYPYFHYDD